VIRGDKHTQGVLDAFRVRETQCMDDIVIGTRCTRTGTHEAPGAWLGPLKSALLCEEHFLIRTVSLTPLFERATVIELGDFQVSGDDDGEDDEKDDAPEESVERPDVVAELPEQRNDEPGEQLLPGQKTKYHVRCDYEVGDGICGTWILRTSIGTHARDIHHIESWKIPTYPPAVACEDPNHRAHGCRRTDFPSLRHLGQHLSLTIFKDGTRAAASNQPTLEDAAGTA